MNKPSHVNHAPCNPYLNPVIGAGTALNEPKSVVGTSSMVVGRKSVASELMRMNALHSRQSETPTPFK